MIDIQELKNLVTEWSLREEIVEKDYVIGWVLWGIGSDPDLSVHWAFKGGTSLKKCYMETWRFSEDLDFTVIPGGPYKPEAIEPIIKKILDRVYDESGIDFSRQPPGYKHDADASYTEGRIYYSGPRQAPPIRIKLDISGSEKLARPTVLRDIKHPYSDALPEPAQVRCYAFEEIFAEKIRAMGERGRPRDLYDIVLISRLMSGGLDSRLIKSVLEEKCRSKGVTVPTLESIQKAQTKDELISEWENMLGHQLVELPPFEQFWDELPNLFNWLNGAVAPKVAVIESREDLDTQWTPPPTMHQWGLPISLESIRFAAVNHLCVDLGYQRSHRLIEPYSLRRTRDGHLLLYAVKVQTREIRAYRVDRIESVKVAAQSFIPKFAIEFSPAGIIPVKPVSGKIGSSPFVSPKRGHASGMKYIFQCPACQKEFKKSTNDPILRAHKNQYGARCYGKRGYFLGSEWD